MPLRLTMLENLLARLNLLPVPLFDTPLGPGITKMLVTACEMQIFDQVGRRGATLEELAAQLQVQPRGLQLLLQILISAGYLHVKKQVYYNTALSRRWLTSESPVNVAPYIIHSPDIVAIWDHVGEVVRTGRSAMRMPYDEDASQPEVQQALARHYAGLAALATALGGEIVQRIRLPEGAERLLDVGGSHAGYSALFCQKYPRLHATVLDIGPGISAGERTAKQMKLEERIAFVSGNIVEDDFPALFEQPSPTRSWEPFDVALYFHIAHLFPADLNAALIGKVARTLRPGGLLIFVDQVTDQTHRSRLASLMVQLMALTMATVGGTCYTFPTIKGWMEEAGLRGVRNHRLLMPGANLITARKIG